MWIFYLVQQSLLTPDVGSLALLRPFHNQNRSIIEKIISRYWDLLFKSIQQTVTQMRRMGNMQEVVSAGLNLVELKV